MKTIDNALYLQAIGEGGKPHQMISLDEAGERQSKPAYPSDLIRIVIFNLPMQSLTMEDATHGRRVIEAIADAPNGKIELEDADYSWLCRIVDDAAPKVLGISAALLKEAITPQDGTRAERRRKK